MAYLFHILAALVVQALGEARLLSGIELPVAVLCLGLVPHPLALLARRLALRGSFRSAESCARLLHHSPVLLHALAVLAFGWIESVSAWTGGDFLLASWPGPSLFLALLPAVVYELIAIDASARLHELAPRERRAVRSFQLRSYLSALAPLVVYLLLAALVGASESLRVHIERIALAHALFVGSLLFLMILALPDLLSNTWETSAIGPGPVHDLFRAVAARAAFRARSLRVWKTSHQMANAMIVGIFAKNRIVLFSDSLLAMLAPRELANVFAHEIGHAKRHHVTIFMAWVAVFFLSGDLLVSWVGSEEGLASTAGAIAAGLGVLALWYLTFGWLSRRFELEADLYALDLLGDPLGMIAALERVGGRLRDIAGWRHFSTANRVSFIGRAAADPGYVRRFRALLRGVTWLGLLLAAGLGLVELLGCLRSLPTDRLLVELCLGRYAAAEERAESIGELDPWLAEAVASAAHYRDEHEDHPTRAVLGESVEEALRTGDLQQAADLAQLLDLRGEPWAMELLEVLEALEEGSTELARRRAEDLGPERRRLLDPWLGAPLPPG